VAAEPLAQYGRYLKAIEMRVEKLQAGGQARDAQGMREKAAIEEKWLLRDQQAREKGLFDERLDEIRWQLEELAISLFAQEVKTLYPISVKRIERRWKELGL
jgi:ATP-dependent helicase HrpA